MNKFMKAAKINLRFDTSKGLIAVEDLWALPLTAKAGILSLDTLAIALNKRVKATGEDSFVLDKTERDTDLDLSFSIVKTVIADRKADILTAAAVETLRIKKARIRELIHGKKDEALAGNSIADLEKMLLDL